MTQFISQSNRGWSAFNQRLLLRRPVHSSQGGRVLITYHYCFRLRCYILISYNRWTSRMATRHAVSADCDGARLDSVRSTDICTIRNRHESAGIHRKTEPLRGPARLPKRATPRPAEPREGRRRVKPRDYYELEPDNWRCTAGREGCGGPVSRGGRHQSVGRGGVQLCGGGRGGG